MRYQLPATATLLFLTTTAALAADAPSGTMTAEQGWSSISRCAQEDTERARHTCLDRVLRDAGLLTAEMHARQERRAFGLDDKAAARASTPPATVTPPTTAAPSATAKASAPGAASAIGAASAPDKTSATTATSPPSSTGASSSPAATAPGSAPAATTGRRASAAPAPTGAAGTTTTSGAPAAPTDRLEVELTKVEKAADGNLFVTTTDGAVWLQAESVQMPQPPIPGDHMTIRKGSLGGYRCSVVSTHLTYRCTRSR